MIEKIVSRLVYSQKTSITDTRLGSNSPLIFEDSIESRTLFSPKNVCYLLDWKPFKNDEKCYSFLLKIFFRSQDI